MESLLWALDLGAVTYLCLWVLRTEKRREKEDKERAAAQAASENKHA